MDGWLGVASMLDSKTFPKTVQKPGLSPAKMELGNDSGGMFQSIRVSGAFLVRPGRAWNAFWVRLEAFELCLGGVLGPSLGVLGGSWHGFVASWRLPVDLLGAFLEDFLPS